MIFQLEWGSYEQSVQYYFEPPEGTPLADFKELCDRLMNESAIDATEGVARSPFHKGIDFRVGQDYCVDEVAERLHEYGYNKVNFPTVKYIHGSTLSEHSEEEVVFTDAVKRRVIEYNRQMDAKDLARFAAAKKLRESNF